MASLQVVNFRPEKYVCENLITSGLTMMQSHGPSTCYYLVTKHREEAATCFGKTGRATPRRQHVLGGVLRLALLTEVDYFLAHCCSLGELGGIDSSRSRPVTTYVYE